MTATTARQRRSWQQKAATIHRKTIDLYREITDAVGEDDYRHTVAGDLMCSAAEAAAGSFKDRG